MTPDFGDFGVIMWTIPAVRRIDVPAGDAPPLFTVPVIRGDPPWDALVGDATGLEAVTVILPGTDLRALLTPALTVPVIGARLPVVVLDAPPEATEPGTLLDIDTVTPLVPAVILPLPTELATFADGDVLTEAAVTDVLDEAVIGPVLTLVLVAALTGAVVTLVVVAALTGAVVILVVVAALTGEVVTLVVVAALTGGVVTLVVVAALTGAVVTLVVVAALIGAVVTFVVVPVLTGGLFTGVVTAAFTGAVFTFTVVPVVTGALFTCVVTAALTGAFVLGAMGTVPDDGTATVAFVVAEVPLVAEPALVLTVLDIAVIPVEGGRPAADAGMAHVPSARHVKEHHPETSKALPIRRFPAIACTACVFPECDLAEARPVSCKMWNFIVPPSSSVQTAYTVKRNAHGPTA